MSQFYSAFCCEKFPEFWDILLSSAISIQILEYLEMKVPKNMQLADFLFSSSDSL